MKALFAALLAVFFMTTANAEVLAVAETMDGGLVSLTDEGLDICEPVSVAFGQPFYLVTLLDGQGNKEAGCWTLLMDGQVGVIWDTGERMAYPASAFRDPQEK